MRRILLTVAYDGTEYCGWQVQPNGITVEEVLTNAIRDLTGENITVTGASRTDSGVHAKGNFATFDTETRIPGEKFALALNTRLPNDVVVVESEEVPTEFSLRNAKSRKTYEYRILNRRMPDPLRCRYTTYWHKPLDVDAMDEAGKVLIGTHDFKSFCNPATQALTTTREILDLSVRREGDEVVIRVTGHGFLYNMVRIIAGTLVRVGSGFWTTEDVKRILEAKDREKSGPTAPPEGLTLCEIVLEDE